MKKNILETVFLIIGVSFILVGCAGGSKESEGDAIGGAEAGGHVETIKNEDGTTTFKTEHGDAIFEENTK